ncbi:LysR substrate-binding domain-containing protein [Shimia sp.]|uniref:hydrogen peroxide-inducible genes activator n=1 Tax=Shimia sp. TaxID=1954381 RepID=UPI003567A7F6
MVNFTLRQLRYFEALAHHMHFGRAADACAISQPALSVQIKELEETLGVPLFERSARRVSLTGFGEDFARRVAEILRATDALGDLARAARQGFSGRLRLGVIPTIAPYLLPDLIRQISGRFPGLELHIRETQTSRLLQELSEGRLDAAILALPVSEPAFVEVELFRERFVLVRPEEARGQPVPSGDMLQGMRLLLLEEGHCFRDQALSFCNLKSALPRESLDGSSLSTLVQMVGAGIGVTLIPEMAVPVETRSARVTVDRFADPQPTRSVGMIWRRSNPLQERLMQIADLLRPPGDQAAGSGGAPIQSRSARTGG